MKEKHFAKASYAAVLESPTPDAAWNAALSLKAGERLQMAGYGGLGLDLVLEKDGEFQPDADETAFNMVSIIAKADGRLLEDDPAYKAAPSGSKPYPAVDGTEDVHMDALQGVLRMLHDAPWAHGAEAADAGRGALAPTAAQGSQKPHAVWQGEGGAREGEAAANPETRDKKGRASGWEEDYADNPAKFLFERFLDALPEHEFGMPGPSKFDGMIVVKGQDRADAIADLFDAAAGGQFCVTGYYDPEEDRRDGCEDVLTGYCYVDVG